MNIRPINRACIFILFLTTTLITSCKKSDQPIQNGSGGGNNAPGPRLSLNLDTIKSPFEAYKANVAITSNTNWTASHDQSWISLNFTAGKGDTSISVSLTKNPDVTVRSGIITVKTATLTRKIIVVQSGNPNNDGVTLIGGATDGAFFFNSFGNGEMIRYSSHDGFSRGLQNEQDTLGVVRMKLVNAEKGTMTVKKRVSNFGYTHYDIDFSNVPQLTTYPEYDKPDTTGRVQIWIYREDGQNIYPATGTRPAVNKIIQVLFATYNSVGGMVLLNSYDHAKYNPHPPAFSTVEQLQDIFARYKWRFNVNQFTWPY